MFHIIQTDGEGSYPAFAFDEEKGEPIFDEHNNTIELEFNTEKEARAYAMENCMNNGFNVYWHIEEI